MNQSKLEVISGSWPKAQENQCEIVTIGFGRGFYFLIGSKSGASFLSQSCNGVGHKRHVTGSDLPSLDRIQMFGSSIILSDHARVKWIQWQAYTTPTLSDMCTFSVLLINPLLPNGWYIGHNNTGKTKLRYMTGKRNISKRWQVTAIPLPLLIIWPKQETGLNGITQTF